MFTLLVDKVLLIEMKGRGKLAHGVAKDGTRIVHSEEVFIEHFTYARFHKIF